MVNAVWLIPTAASWGRGGPASPLYILCSHIPRFIVFSLYWARRTRKASGRWKLGKFSSDILLIYFVYWPVYVIGLLLFILIFLSLILLWPILSRCYCYLSHFIIFHFVTWFLLQYVAIWSLLLLLELKSIRPRVSYVDIYTLLRISVLHITHS